jgi:hypothetical protein
VESLDDKIWLTILDIGYEIKRVIRQKESRGGAIEIPEEKNIFVAITTPDQQRYRQNLRRELQHLGINVLPNRHLPEDYHELKDRVEKCLAESFIFVHMLGYQYGSSLGDTASSIVELQNDIVTEYIREKTNLSANLDDTIRYVWINPDTELMTQEQKRYIEKIKTDKEFLKNTEIIETPFELFKTVIKARAEKESELKKGSEEEEQGLSSLYLIAENYDVPFLKKLESHLQEQNFRINKLIPDPPNVNLYSLHKKYLVDSSAVLVYYDQENSNWLNSKLSDILKAPGFGKKEPFQAKALIMDEKLESNIYSMTPDLKIIKFNNKGYQPEILDSFINQFRKQK